MYPNLVKICPVAETENRISSILLHINHVFLNPRDNQETRGKERKRRKNIEGGREKERKSILNQEKDGDREKERCTAFWIKRKGGREEEREENGSREFPDHERVLNLDPKRSTDNGGQQFVGKRLVGADSGAHVSRTL